MWSPLVFAILLCLALAARSSTVAQSSFPDVASLQGLLSVWTSPSASGPSGGNSRGCSAAFELSSAATLSYLTATPCISQSAAQQSWNFVSYFAPATGLIRSSSSQPVYYSLMVPAPADPIYTEISLLATLSATTGATLSLVSVPASIIPSALLVDPAGPLVYLVSFQSQALTLYVVDPRQTNWTGALHSTVPVSSSLPLGLWWLRDTARTAAFLPISRRILLVGASGSSVLQRPSWQIMSINPSTGSSFTVTLNDSSVFASNTLAFTVLGQSDVVLISSDTAAWLVDFSNLITTGLAVRMTSVDQHLQRAKEALGCGHIGVSVDVSPSTVPSSASSLPFVMLLMYAEPTPLSVIRNPFWYLLLLDPTLNVVTYVSINAPPLFLGQLSPLPSVSQLTNAASGALAYSVTAGAALLWIGTGFVGTGNYSCNTQSSNTAAVFINSTALQCSLPADLSNDVVAASTTGASSTLPITLLLDDAFVLYQGRLVVPGATGHQGHTVTTTNSLQSSISRTVVSYSIASSLTPSPVVSGSASAAFAPTGLLGQQSPLQLHTQVTRGLTYVAQQVLNLTNSHPSLSSSQVLPALTSQLGAADWTQSIGLSDVFALFSMGSQAGSDFANMYTSAVGVLSQDSSSLPQTLTGLLSGGASSLSLDMLGSQVQGWLTDTVATPLSGNPDLDTLLNLGVTLPDVSSTTLSQLTSLGVDAVLQQFDNVPVLGDILSDGSVSGLLNLPDQLNDVVDDPTDLIESLLPGGAIKDTVLSLLSGDDDDLISFAGSISDTVGGLLDNVGDTVSDLVDTVSDLGSSFADDLAGDAVDSSSGGLMGPISSLAGLIAGDLGASSEVQQVVSAAVDVVGGIGEIFCGDFIGGIGDILSGIGSLFGFGGGPDETQQLSQQMTKDFNQVLTGLSDLSQQVTTDTNTILSDLGTVQTNLLQADQQLSTQINAGFNELVNLTLTGFTSLQKQQYAYYSSEVQTLANVLQGIESDTLSLSAAATTLQAVQTEVLSLQASVQQNYRNSLINSLENSMTSVQSAIASSESSFASTQHRMLPSISLQQYQSAMLSICHWATIDSPTNAADTTMSGDSTSSSTLASRISLQPNYDLSMALLPGIVSVYLKQTVPSSLSTLSTPLPNPLAWAFAVNFWLEGRQAALQTPSGDPTNACVKAYWQTGQQLQGYVRLAVAQSTLQAAAAQVSTTAAHMYTALQTAMLAEFPSTVPAPLDLSNFLTTLNTPGSAFAAFDDACAVATLLLSLAQATGLGSNGFTNGFVNTGSANPPTPSQSYQPGQAFTTLTAFAPVTSAATFITLYVNTVNLSLAHVSASSAAAVQSQQAAMLQQASFLLNWTAVAAQNAIAAFYPPCSVGPTTAPQSLAVIDTTLRRLAGFMVQNQVGFSFQGQAVPILAATKAIVPTAAAPLSSTAPSGTSSSAASWPSTASPTSTSPSGTSSSRGAITGRDSSPTATSAAAVSSSSRTTTAAATSVVSSSSTSSSSSLAHDTSATVITSAPLRSTSSSTPSPVASSSSSVSPSSSAASSLASSSIPSTSSSFSSLPILPSSAVSSTSPPAVTSQAASSSSSSSSLPSTTATVSSSSSSTAAPSSATVFSSTSTSIVVTSTASQSSSSSTAPPLSMPSSASSVPVSTLSSSSSSSAVAAVSSSNSGGGSSSHTAAIAGAVAGVVVLAILLLLLFVFCRRRDQDKPDKRSDAYSSTAGATVSSSRSSQPGLATPPEVEMYQPPARINAEAVPGEAWPTPMATEVPAVMGEDPWATGAQYKV